MKTKHCHGQAVGYENLSRTGNDSRNRAFFAFLRDGPTIVAIVPHHISQSPWAMVSDGASRRIMNTFLVTKYVKRKMIRTCNSRQVDFVHKEHEDATNPNVKWKLYNRIPRR